MKTKNNTETLKEKAERIKQETAYEEETCEKCGGELKTMLIGDESYYRCIDCGWVNN